MICIWGQIKSDCDGNFAQEHYGNEESSFLKEAGKSTWIRYLVFFLGYCVLPKQQHPQTTVLKWS